MKCISFIFCLFCMPALFASEKQLTLSEPCFRDDAEILLDTYVPKHEPLRYLKSRHMARASSLEDANLRLKETKRELTQQFCDSTESGWIDDQAFDRCTLDLASSVHQDKDGSFLIRIYAVNCKIVRTIQGKF